MKLIMENWRSFLSEKRLNVKVRKLNDYVKQLGIKPGEVKKHPRGFFVAMLDKKNKDGAFITRVYDNEKEALEFLGVQSADDAGAEIEVDDSDIVSSEPEKEPEEKPEDNPRLAQRSGWTFI